MQNFPFFLAPPKRQPKPQPNLPHESESSTSDGESGSEQPKGYYYAI